MYRRFWIKLATSVVAAGGAMTALVGLSRPPALHEVAIVTHRVVAMHTIPSSAIHWTAVSSPPAHAVRSSAALVGLVAQQNLAPGTVLLTGDFTAPQRNHLRPGEVQWLVKVSAAASGLPAAGQRVDVWTTTGGAYRQVAGGVRVVGLYTSGGQPVGSSANTNTGSGPGMVALAVPYAATGTLLNVSSPTLVIDPGMHQFALTGPSTGRPTIQAKHTRAAAKTGTKKP